MDGYIKNQQQAIHSIRLGILGKCSLSVYIFLFAFVFLLGLAALQPPESWQQTDIVFSGVYREHMGLRRGTSTTIHCADGDKFIIGLPVPEERLKIGQTYSVIYSQSILGEKTIKGLSSGNDVLLDPEAAIQFYRGERKSLVISFWIIFALGILAIIVIDRTWCRKDHAKIKHLQEKIRQRQEKRGK